MFNLLNTGTGTLGPPPPLDMNEFPSLGGSGGTINVSLQLLLQVVVVLTSTELINCYLLSVLSVVNCRPSAVRRPTEGQCGRRSNIK